MFTRDENTGRLRLGLSTPPQTVEGIDFLVQLVAMSLLNGGGRSIFNPGRGGGLRQYIGQNYDPEDPAELLADITIIVNRVDQSIKEEQNLVSRHPSERLSEIIIVDLRPNEEAQEIDLIIYVVNEEDKQAQAAIPV